MASLTQAEIENFKQHRWFILQHLNSCSICGKVFGFNDNSYFGLLKDGTFAYTCEECSKILKDPEFYTNYHNHPFTIPVPNAKLWRYMDLAKFLSLLESSSLFFTRIDHFQDPFEGTLGTMKNEKSWAAKEKAWRKRWIELESKNSNINLNDREQELLADQKFQEYRDNIKKWRTKNYVCCWHQSDIESEAMWQLYTRDSKQGIAIQTTFERLYQALPPTPQPSFGMVKYVNFDDYNNGLSQNTFHSFEAPWYKRASFAHEKEFRVIIEHMRNPGFRDWSKLIQVDLNILIENVYISPEAERWFADLIKNIIRNRYKLCLNVNQSRLNETPFF